MSTLLSLNGNAQFWLVKRFISGLLLAGRCRFSCSTNSSIERLVSWSMLRSLMCRSFRVFCPKKM